MSTVSLTPSGSHLCVTTRAASCTLFVYSITTLSPLQNSLLRSQVRAHDSPVALSAIDTTGTLLATGSADGIVKVWDIAGGFVTHVLRGHGAIVSAIAFDFDFSNPQRPRSKLATSSVDGRIRIWDLNDRPKQGIQKPLATLGGHVSVVRGLSISSDGKRMVSGSRDQTVSLWQLVTTKGKGEEIWSLLNTLSVAEGVEACAFIDGSNDLFYTGGTSSEIRTWSFSHGSVVNHQPHGRWSREAFRNERNEDENLQGIVSVHEIVDHSSGPKQQVLLSFHADSRVSFRIATGSASRQPLTRLRQLVGFNDEAVDIANVCDKAIAIATNSSAVRVYPLPDFAHSSAVGHDFTATVQLLPNESSNPGHSDFVISLDATENGGWIASGSKDRTARIWSFSSEDDEWRCIAVAEGHAESVGAVCFSKKSAEKTDVEGRSGVNFLVTASQDRTVKIWDLSSLFSHELGRRDVICLKSLITLKVHEKAINSVDIAPNNSLLATGSQDRTAKLFTITYNPPSKANNYTPSAKVTPLAALKGHKRGVWSVSFSPTDPALLTTSGDRTAKLWSLRDFSCVKTFEGHSHSVLKGHFLNGSKGTQMITTGADGLIKIWNVKDEECTTTLDGPEDADRLWSVASYASGAGIATVGADGFIRFYKDVTEQLRLEEHQERAKGVEREQAYENLLAVEDYRSAILICLAEGQPRRLLSLFNSVAAKSQERRVCSQRQANSKTKHVEDNAARLMNLALTDGATLSEVQHDAESITGLTSVDQALANLPSTQLLQLLTYIRAWNASIRTASVAQNVLHCLLRSYTAQDLLDAFERQRHQDVPHKISRSSSTKKKPSGVVALPELLSGLIPFSERHYSRAERTLIESSILEYTVQLMGDVGDEIEKVGYDMELHEADSESAATSGESDGGGELSSELHEYT